MLVAKRKPNTAYSSKLQYILNFVVNMKTTTLTEHQNCSEQQYVNSCNETVKKPPNQTKLKHKELNSKAWRYRSHDDVPITSQGHFGNNQQIINIPTLKRIIERNGWFNRHRDTRELNVDYQRIKPPINKTIGKTFQRENANVLHWLPSSRFQDSGPATYPQQNSTIIHDNAHTKLKQIMHTDKKQQQTVYIYT